MDNLVEVSRKPQVGDIVYMSRDSGYPWKVLHTNVSDNTLYIKSQVGGRTTQVSTNQVVGIWRDPTFKPVNNRNEYPEETKDNG